MKLPKKVQEKFFSHLEIFSQNVFDERLNNHELRGKYKFCRSINITGDIRAIYRRGNNSNEEVLFIDIGSHSELYS